MNFQTFTVTALVTLALYTAQNFIRYLRAADWNGALGILLSWLIGFGVAEWLAHSAATANLHLIDGGATLGALDFGSLLLVGLALGSAAPPVADFFKSIDNTRSSAKPRLVKPKVAADGAVVNEVYT